MLPKSVFLRNLAIATPLVLAGILIVLIPVYSRMHRNPVVPVEGAQTWAVTDPRYSEAYRGASSALLAANPGMRPAQLGEFDPARVSELGDGRYSIRVAYYGSGPAGALIGKEAVCIVRLRGNVWSVESAEAIPEFAPHSDRR